MDRPPNILYILTDQHRADYLGCAGHPLLRTPHIDSIAKAGTRFDNFYVASPSCMPNRAALMTGRYPAANGARHNGCPLPYCATTFVDVLLAAGYHTAMIGKSHLQPASEAPARIANGQTSFSLIDEARRCGGSYEHERPGRFDGLTLYDLPRPYYGFEHVRLVSGHGNQTNGHYRQWLRTQTHMADAWHLPHNQLTHSFSSDQAYRTPIPENLHPTAYIRDEAISYLKGNSRGDRPFFLMVSFSDPRHPFSPPGRYWDFYSPEMFNHTLPFGKHRNPTPPMQWLYQNRGLPRGAAEDCYMASELEIREAMALTCGSISMIDDAVGHLLDALHDTKTYEETVIVFNSDHGDYMGDYNLLLKGPLMLQSLIKVSFIWSDPEWRSERVSHALASTVDIAPTILERASQPLYNGIQGRSLIEGICGNDCARRELLIEYEDSRPRLSFRSPVRARSLVTRSHRLTIYSDEDWGELYDLERDPCESNNLWRNAAHEKKKNALVGRLLREVIEVSDESPRARMRA